MKKSIFVALALLVAVGAWAQRPDAGAKVYTWYNSAIKTLNFVYDPNYDVNDYAELYDPNSTTARWVAFHEEVEHIVIDISMAQSGLTSFKSLFFGGSYYDSENGGTSVSKLINVTSITGLQNLHTENVTDMSRMFMGLRSITSLDLSSFNTSNVTNMNSMFNDVGVKNLDLSMFDTRKVTNMYAMFGNSSKLQSVNLSSFSTIKVTDMSYMFLNCAQLKNVDIMNFNFSSVTTTERMFSCCSQLEKIYCDKDLRDAALLTNSQNMFYACAWLTGWNGTTYDAEHLNVYYAHPDGSSKGYFSYPRWDGVLDNVASDVYAYSGTVIRGTFVSSGKTQYRIFILPGAKVTLDNVTFNAEKFGVYSHAALNGMGGSDTIMLKGTNIVRSYNKGCPAIHIPYNHTLVIDKAEDGASLEAYGNDGAGIGGGDNLEAGTIIIKGGSVTAVGGDYSAGIGGGYNANNYFVRIQEGATVHATGGKGAAGLGGGYGGTCKEIDIDSKVKKVTAVAGENAPYSVGPGQNGDMNGIIWIGTQQIQNGIETNPFVYPDTEGIEQIVNRQSSNIKVLRDGQMLILVGDKTYNATGVEVR